MFSYARVDVKTGSVWAESGRWRSLAEFARALALFDARNPAEWRFYAS